MKRCLTLFIFLLTIHSNFAANRYWISAVASNWNNTANWSTTNGGPGGASVPGATDDVFFNNNGVGNCLVDIAATINSINIASGYSGIIDINGNVFNITGATNNEFAGGTINDTPGTSSLTINSTARTRFLGTTFGAIVNASSRRLYLNGSIFNAAATFTKTGTGSDNGTGGNTFNGTTTLINSSSNYLLLGNTNPDVFNADLTVTNSGISLIYLAHNSAGNQFNGNIILNATSGNGIRFGNNAGTSTLAATKTISIGGSGFSSGSLRIRGFTQTGATAQTITLTGSSSLYLEQNSTWNGNVNFVAPRIFVRQTTFNGTASITKTGASSDYSYGGNTFNSTSTIINNGTGHLYFAQTSPDTFNGDVTLTVGGTGRIYMANTAAGNAFNGNIYLNYNSNQNIYIGNNSGTSTLANTKTISVLSYGASGCGNLYLEELTQLGATAQNISLGGNGTAILSIGPSSTFNADITTSSPGLLIRQSTFNGITSFEKTGSSGNTSYGGNTYNAATTITNSGSNYLRLGGTLGNTYNSTVTFNSTGSNSIEIARVGNTSFNDNITFNSTGSSTGIFFCNGGGTVVLAATKTVNIGGSGFSTGELRFRNFTQTGNTPQALTLTGTSLLYNYNANWGGDVVFIAPRLNTRGTLYNRTAYLEKTGASNDYSAGGNTFAMNVDFVNSGSGYLRLGNGTFDTYSANVTLTNSGTSNMYFAYNGAGHTVAGNLTATNSATGTTNGIYIGTGSTSTLNVTGNVSLTQNGSATTLYTYLGDQGDITVNGTVTMTNSGTGTTSNMIIANNTNSAVTIAGTTTITNNSTATTTNRMYIGNQGDVTFNGTLDLINNAGVTNSGIYCNYNSNSNNLYNQNITVQSTNANCDGVRFGQNGGTGTLAATKTITVGAGGFIAGDLEFRNFTQIGNTAQALTCTGTARIYNYDANWGGDVTFIAPRNNTRGTTYNRTAYLEKTGATDDQSAGGNTFTMNVDFVNSGSGYLRLGDGTFDTYSANVTLTNSGTSNMYFAYNGAGHTVAGNLTATNSATGTTNGIYIGTGSTSTLNVTGNVSLTQNGSATTLYTYLGDQGDITVNGTVIMTNSGTGTTSNMIIANNTNSAVTIAGTTTITNNSTATTTNRIYIGNQGDIIFNGVLNLINNAGVTNSEIYCNYNTNSSNSYNQNVTVQSTNANCDGIRFGQNGGTGTLAATKTITIGGGGFIAGELRFRNFTQLGATPQSLTLTGSALLRFRDGSIFNGNITTVSPRLFIEGGTFNGTTSLTKNGNYNDDSRGGSIFNGVTTITNSSANRMRLNNNNSYSDDFNNNVTFVRSGTGAFNVSRVGTSTFSGNVNINGASIINFGSGGGTAKFDGTSAQSINDVLGSSYRPDFYRLEMNNSSNNLTLNMPIRVRTTLTLNNGDINSTATNLLTMADNATVAAVSNASYVSGPVEKVGNDAFTFPVGDGGYYAPSVISAPASTTDKFEAQYILSSPHAAGYDSTSKAVTINHISHVEYWYVNRTNGTSNVTVTLSWDTLRSGGVTNLADLVVAHWDGATWNDLGNGGTTGTTNNGTVITSAPVTSFSPFTLASTTVSNPLPVELLSFTGKLNNSQVDLEWETASEINNDYFIVERSSDGVNFEPIGRIDGKGNYNGLSKYNLTDFNPLQGVSYYRLKQTDFDGKFEYSDIISITYSPNNMPAINSNMTLYPNPAKNGSDVKLEITGMPVDKEVLVVVTNVLGQQMYSKVILTDNNGNLLYAIDPYNQLPSGTYIIVATADDKLLSKRLVISQ